MTSEWKEGDYITVDTLQEDGYCGHSFGYFIEEKEGTFVIKSETTGDTLIFDPKSYQRMKVSKGWWS